MAIDRIAVIDVETTGLSPWRGDRIIEIAVVIMSPDGEVHSEYETLVNPGRDIGKTALHRIAAADVLRAPSFSEIAGDLLEILAGSNVVAGHNVSFDKNFLVKEYERESVIFPDVPLLCTLRQLGRNNLANSCAEFGVPFDGTQHRALHDARATAKLVSIVCADNPLVLDEIQSNSFSWPSLPVRSTACFCREDALRKNSEPPKFLQRIVSLVRHDSENELPNSLAYLALIDRVLEDRIIDEAEEHALVDAAVNLRLSAGQVDAAHKQYLQSLAVLAIADGVITESERSDLHLVARILGQDDSSLDQMLDLAANQFEIAIKHKTVKVADNNLQGQRVCFTGELMSTIGGKPITREMAECLATSSGLSVVGSVTKKLDLLVVADPSSQSGKAKKAREYGTRIVADMVFWRMLGIAID